MTFLANLVRRGRDHPALVRPRVLALYEPPGAGRERVEEHDEGLTRAPVGPSPAQAPTSDTPARRPDDAPRAPTAAPAADAPAPDPAPAGAFGETQPPRRGAPPAGSAETWREAAHRSLSHPAQGTAPEPPARAPGRAREPGQRAVAPADDGGAPAAVDVRDRPPVGAAAPADDSRAHPLLDADEPGAEAPAAQPSTAAVAELVVRPLAAGAARSALLVVQAPASTARPFEPSDAARQPASRRPLRIPTSAATTPPARRPSAAAMPLTPSRPPSVGRPAERALSDDAPASAVHVTIGRIEVRAAIVPAPRIARQQTAEPMSLEEHLRERAGARR